MSKGTASALMPVSARRSLVAPSADVAATVQVLFYADAADALVHIVSIVANGRRGLA